MPIDAETIKKLIDVDHMKMKDVAAQLGITLGQCMDLYYGTTEYSKEMGGVGLDDFPVSSLTQRQLKAAVEEAVTTVLRREKLIK